MNIEVRVVKNNLGHVTRRVVNGLSYNFACDMVESVCKPTEFKMYYMNNEVYYKDRKTMETVAHYNEVWGGNLVIKEKYIDMDKWNNYIKVKW